MLYAINSLRPQLVAAAQDVYDSWHQDETGYCEEHAYGGICHIIAEAFREILEDHNINTTSFSQSIGPVHVWAVADVDGMAYRIDIPPQVYESGYGYEWTKLADVIFSENDVVVEPMGYPFEDYLEE